jgi:hypothetical protein
MPPTAFTAASSCIEYDQRTMTIAKRLRRPRSADLAAFAWVLVIYCTIPLVQHLREWFVDRWGESVIGYAVIASLLILSVAAFRQLRRAHRPPLATIPWLIAISGIYLWWTSRLWERPEEAIHLLEYGLLGVLLYRALRSRVDDATVFISAALLAGLAGTVDEIIQWMTPGRYWDFRDIGINSGSSALALVGMWRLSPPSAAVTVRSWRLAARLAAIQLLLLALCVSNTPERVAWYSERIPGLEFLRYPTNEMVEYGHRHVIAPLGEFKSRFAIEELIGTDAERWREAAAILDRYPPGRYGEFLRDFPASRDPFVHEARVHISNRTHHLSDRRDHPEGSRDRRVHSTVALREHQILENFFGRTYRGTSSFDLRHRRVEELKREALDDFYFVSKAGQHLITSVTEKTLRWAFLTPAMLLFACSMFLRPKTPLDASP